MVKGKYNPRAVGNLIYAPLPKKRRFAGFRDEDGWNILIKRIDRPKPMWISKKGKKVYE